MVGAFDFQQNQVKKNLGREKKEMNCYRCCGSIPQAASGKSSLHRGTK
jgi:hypothetical protein